MPAPFTTSQAAAFLGVTSSRVRQLCASGELPAEPIQAGGKVLGYLIQKKDLVARLRHQKAYTGPGRPPSGHTTRQANVRTPKRRNISPRKKS